MRHPVLIVANLGRLDPGGCRVGRRTGGSRHASGGPRRGYLVWGADSEGGGPYVYPHPADPRRITGFEAELADLLAGRPWACGSILSGPLAGPARAVGTGQIDIVLNGYELTPARAGQMLHTRPYYIYQLVLLGRPGDPQLRSWDDVRRHAPRARS